MVSMLSGDSICHSFMKHKCINKLHMQSLSTEFVLYFFTVSFAN